MANFDKALKDLFVVEGRYVNDGADVGGETYCGISFKGVCDISRKTLS
jgi:lysozyme family protein